MTCFDTWFYYVQSRYYDPAIGRFINADAFASTGQGLLGNNMFAYCGNNPVNLLDFAGCFPVPAWFYADPMDQAISEFFDWYRTSNENEEDCNGNLTVNAKLKRSAHALGTSIEFIVGVGLGMQGSGSLGEYASADFGISYDLLRIEYIDGQYDVSQYSRQGLDGDFFGIILASASEAKKKSYLSSYGHWTDINGDEVANLWGMSVYFFGGGTVEVNWDMLGLMNDLSVIWGD